MKVSRKDALLSLAISLTLHVVVIMALAPLWDRSEDALWSGGKTGRPDAVFVELSAGPAMMPEDLTQKNASKEASPTVPEAKNSPVVTRTNASKKSGSPILTHQSSSKPRHKSASSGATTAGAKPGAGEGDAPTAAGGRGNGADAFGTVSENAPNVLASIRAKILARQKYPAEARRNGEKGTVKVGFKILPNGTVAALSVIKSSGHASLDNAALTAVRAAAPLPYFPKMIALPLEYRLK